MQQWSLDDEGTETDISIQTASKARLYLVTAVLCSLILCLLVVIANRLSA